MVWVRMWDKLRVIAAFLWSQRKFRAAKRSKAVAGGEL